jgi:predicted RNA-binding Zn-ribbon protein involved in translation (DUF1610 family)
MNTQGLDRMMQGMMPRVEYPWCNTYQPGTWKGVLIRPRGRTASFTCPKCGHTMILAEHRIGKRGKVWPSVVCPTEKCKFHEHIQLKGWTER